MASAEAIESEIDQIGTIAPVCRMVKASSWKRKKVLEVGDSAFEKPKKKKKN